MARRGDAGFAIDGFAGRRATFFDVVHECSGKEDVLRFFVQHLVVRLLKQRGDSYFGMGEDIAFAVPFGALRHVGHVCQPLWACRLRWYFSLIVMGFGVKKRR